MNGEDFRDLVRLLEEHPEWRAELRRLLLTEDVLSLPQLVRELATAQARTEAAVARLAEAQTRTEERVGRLEGAVARLDEAVARLAEAQTRTERAVAELARQVGGLIEDIADIVLHDVLGRVFGWEVGVLERAWQRWNGKPEEVNVFGRARDPARPERTIWIVGEAKHNLTLAEVRRFARQVERARRHLPGEVFAVCFCYRARPEVRARLQELRIPLVFS